ncbi:sigma factor G inhibitor Gin [Clostridium oceanicum]|uniref:Sigma factor G inhibitor Gin n=1 Tax=Clostridium oceanicum TaxID=1543 RepID=A0ABP3UZM5_9CLOT
MKKQRCIICGKPLSSGIMINRKGICSCCEKRIINIKMDTDFYEFYRECIKKNIVPTIIKEEEFRCQSYQF